MVAPTINVLIDLFSNRGDLVEQSEIVESAPLQDMDISRLLEAKQYQAYTNFIFTTTCERFD